MKATCIDCGRACTPTAYRCRRCQCRETWTYTRTTNKHRTRRRAMNSTPRLGDIGEGQEEIELEPLEIPQPVPAEPIPA